MDNKQNKAHDHLWHLSHQDCNNGDKCSAKFFDDKDAENCNTQRCVTENRQLKTIGDPHNRIKVMETDFDDNGRGKFNTYHVTTTLQKSGETVKAFDRSGIGDGGPVLIPAVNNSCTPGLDSGQKHELTDLQHSNQNKRLRNSCGDILEHTPERHLVAQKSESALDDVFEDEKTEPRLGSLHRRSSIRKGVVRSRSTDGTYFVRRIHPRKPSSEPAKLANIAERPPEGAPDRLGSLSKDHKKTDQKKEKEREKEKEEEPNENADITAAGDDTLTQRSVIIQRDASGFGFKIRGDNPVFINFVKENGPAARAGVYDGDRLFKVNGTLVTNSGHKAVAEMIRASGAYVQLTLLGKPASQERKSCDVPLQNNTGRVTAPQPVDAAKTKQMQDEKASTMKQMLHSARDQFGKAQKEYLRNPTEKNRQRREEASRTLRNIEEQLEQMSKLNAQRTSSSSAQLQQPEPSGGELDDIQEDKENTTEPSHTPWLDGGPKHQKALSMPDSIYNVEGHREVSVSRSHSDGQRHKKPAVVDVGHEDPLNATSLPAAESGAFFNQSPSSSPITSPEPVHPANAWSPPSDSGVSDTNDDAAFEQSMQTDSSRIGLIAPLHPVRPDIISMEDDDFASEEEQFVGQHPIISVPSSATRLHFIESTDHGPFNSLMELREKPAHMAVFLHYLISNSDPSPLLFYLTSDAYGAAQGNAKELRRWASDIYQAFMTEKAPLRVYFEDDITTAVDNMIQHKVDQELRNIFYNARQRVALLISDLLADYRSKRDIGLANLYGDEEVTGRNLSSDDALHYMEKKLSSHLEKLLKEDGFTSDRNKAMGSALVTYIQHKGAQIKNHSLYDSCPPGFTSKEERKIMHRAQKAAKKDKVKPKRKSFLDKIRKPSSNSPAAIHEAQRRHDEGLLSPSSPIYTIRATPQEEDEDIEQMRQEKKVSTITARFQNDVIDTQSHSTPPRGSSPEPHQDTEENDVQVDPHVIKTLSGSGSSSNSSLNNARGPDSPSTSTEAISALSLQTIQDDSDFEVEQELPSLDSVIPKEILKKLKPKEKKRQDVINELFHTERAHVRNLKVMHKIFYIPMLQLNIAVDMATLIFPNLDELLEMHISMNTEMKTRRKESSQIENVGDILLERFDGESGDKFKKACSTFCQNQSQAFEVLRQRPRKEPKLMNFLNEQASRSECRRLELKDFLPTVMQRLTKYPLLIENLLKYTNANSAEFTNLKKALDLSKGILTHVNQCVQECEMRQKLMYYQQHLDKKGIQNSNLVSLQEFKNLDLSRHRLLYEGPLTWRIHKSKQLDLQCLLLEDILVLLQKQDDKFILKCHSTNIGNDSTKFTHSPIIKLQDVLPRNVATDKRAFFVVSMSELTPQIYDLIAMSTDEKKRWFKYLEEAAKKAKEGKTSRPPSKPVPPAGEATPEPAPPVYDDTPEVKRVSMEEDDSVIFGHKKTRSLDSLENLPRVEVLQASEFVQPTEVVVSQSILEDKAEPVVTSVEMLKRKDEEIIKAMEEKQMMVADYCQVPKQDYEHIAELAGEMESSERDLRELVMGMEQQLHRLTELVRRATTISDSTDAVVPSSASPEGATALVSEEHRPVSATHLYMPKDSLWDVTKGLKRNLGHLWGYVERDAMSVSSQAMSSELSGHEPDVHVASSNNSISHASRPNSYISVGSSDNEHALEMQPEETTVVPSRPDSAFIVQQSESAHDQTSGEQPTGSCDLPATVSEFKETTVVPDHEMWQQVDSAQCESQAVKSTSVVVMQESSIQQVHEQFESISDANANLNVSTDSMEPSSGTDTDSTGNTVTGASF